jgi:hypothetical protein
MWQKNKGVIVVLALVAGAIVVILLTRKPAAGPVIVQQTPTPQNQPATGPWDFASAALPFLFPPKTG